MWDKLRTIDPPPIIWLPAATFALSAGLLAGAHAFERIGGLAPCDLCLVQREVHWVILGLSVLALIAFLKTPVRGVTILFYAVLALAFAWSAGVAGHHAGVEYGWWEGPASCSAGAAAPGTVSAENLLESLQTQKNVVPCDKAAWTLAGISMAGYNFLISLAGSLAILWLGLTGRKRLEGVLPVQSRQST